jgi:four helix bundle protein
MKGFQSPEEFAAWQLAWELKERVYAFTATEPAVRDRKFCDEIRTAARSAPDNISEGFYRFNPVDFANFVRIARGSLGEVRNQITHAHSKRCLTESEFQAVSRLCRRAIAAATGLRLYLLSLPKNFDPRVHGYRCTNRSVSYWKVEPDGTLRRIEDPAVPESSGKSRRNARGSTTTKGPTDDGIREVRGSRRGSVGE